TLESRGAVASVLFERRVALSRSLSAAHNRGHAAPLSSLRLRHQSDMTHEEKIAHWIGAGKVGTEIGPGATPVPGLEPPPIYVDCFKEFGAAPNRADFYGHACALPFHDHSLDYVLASHVLEHVANPVAALAEWYRVVRPDGIIYLIVPNRLSTFDH